MFSNAHGIDGQTQKNSFFFSPPSLSFRSLKRRVLKGAHEEKTLSLCRTLHIHNDRLVNIVWIV